MINDKTNIRPRPGGRKAAESDNDQTRIRPRPGGEAKQAAEQADATQVRPRAKASRTVLQLREAPAMGRGSLTELAATLLSLAARIGQLQGQVDVDQLHQQCLQQMRLFMQQAKQAKIHSEKATKAQYVLCALLDETVLNTHWGEHSRWSQSTLLRVFHQETSGGDRVFRMIEQALGDGRKDLDFLELAYLCLSLGFAGKYRIDPEGRFVLDKLRADLYECLHEARDRYRRDLSPHVKPAFHLRNRLHSFFPVWVITVVLALAGFGIYTFLLIDLNRSSDHLVSAVAELVPPPERLQTSAGNERSVAVRLRQLLAPELEQGVLDVEDSGKRLSVVLQAEELFESGSADLASAFEPILYKIAKALEAIPGAIIVAGHTDSLAIRTARFPSNWHLSLARASAVVRYLSETGELTGRLVPEGRAETQPVADNATEEGRARNRRVVIEITHVSE